MRRVGGGFKEPPRIFDTGEKANTYHRFYCCAKEVADMPKDCLILSLHKEASHIKASDGREIPFAKAILKVNNDCGTDVVDVTPHATLGQEGGTVQDVSHAISGAAATLPAGGDLRWDVYDLLLPAHLGAASRIHMFGYRAALNWRFELAVWADYRHAASSAPMKTPIARWTIQWSVPDASSGAVELAIIEVAAGQ
jgi:hypothetical protein